MVNEVFDFLIRNRRWFVGLIIVGILVFAYWLAVKLVRRSGNASTAWETSVIERITLRDQLLTHHSGAGNVMQSILWYVALITAYIERAKALGKIGALIGVAVIVLIGSGLWFYDRNEKHIVTARLNFPESQCTREHRNGAVIFIHGWTGDASETWKRYPTLMCDDERYATFEIVSVGYPTLMDQRGLNVVQIAEWIFEGLRDRLKITERERLIFVAHSMGGLVAREITLLHRLSSSPGNIVLLAELGTPHNGAQTAPLALALGLSKPLTVDMFEGSGTLKGLHVRWNQLADRPKTLCYSSPQDSVVSQASAFYQCDYQFSFAVWNHTELVKPESREDDRYRLPTQEIARRLHF